METPKSVGAVPEEAVAALLWLECKRVLREGGSSMFFPDLDRETAAQIRGMGSVDAVREWISAEGGVEI